MANPPYGLSDNIIRQLQSVFAKQRHIERVDIFGSRARGDYKPSSDIDFAVYGTSNFTFQDYTGLMAKLDDLSIVFKIDVVDMTSLDKKELRDCIARDGKVFWKKV